MITIQNGVSIATSAALVAFAVAAPVTQAAAAGGTVHCYGVNTCKGTSDCKTAKNDCKGQNSCKGQGWVSMSKADCKDAKAKAAAAK